MERQQIKESEVWAALKFAQLPLDIFSNAILTDSNGEPYFRSSLLGFTTHNDSQAATFWVAFLGLDGVPLSEMVVQLHAILPTAIRQGSWVYFPDVYVLWGE